jgi:hypothetical protein
MNDKQQEAYDLAIQLTSRDVYERVDKMNIVFGVMMLATKLDAGSKKLDDLWRSLHQVAVES